MIGQRVVQFLDGSDSTTTINGYSAPIYVGSGYDGKPVTIHIYDAAGLTCTIQGCLVVGEGTNPPAEKSTEWVSASESITGNDISNMDSSVTWIRIYTTAGTCKARIKY